MSDDQPEDFGENQDSAPRLKDEPPNSSPCEETNSKTFTEETRDAAENAPCEMQKEQAASESEERTAVALCEDETTPESSGDKQPSGFRNERENAASSEKEDANFSFALETERTLNFIMGTAGVAFNSIKSLGSESTAATVPTNNNSPEEMDCKRRTQTPVFLCSLIVNYPRASFCKFH